MSGSARDALSDRRNQVYASTASAWEIATKVRLGKMPQMVGRVEHYGELVSDDGFLHLDVSFEHALLGGSLAARHKDPFDRLLAAQAVREGMTLVTGDAALKTLGCKTLW